MGNVMRGLVHPCKVYNIMAVGAPVVYVGPTPSHVTEIFDRLPDYPWVSAEHGEPAALAEHIRRMASEGKDRPRAQSQAMLAAFSKATLIPQMIAAIEPDNTSGKR
jgi:colanic acid biosynthesis glycosyl transferase WcaI